MTAESYGFQGIEGTLLSGRPSALLRSAPLRTGRAAFIASGSSKPGGVACGQKCRVAAVAGVLAVAVGV